jgi:hypothetical protein
MRGVLAALVLVIASVAGAGSAQAASSGGALTCGDAADFSRPFASFLDPLLYRPLPGGDFEAGGTGWSLAGGAKVVSGNEPWRVRSSTDARSLYLPARASATSPPFCLSLASPTIRFFRAGGGLPLFTDLKVEVIYKGLLGQTTVLPVLHLPQLTTQWHPTEPMLVLANITGVLSLDGLTTTAQLRFTARGASYRVDDIYVDPFWQD